MDNTTFFFSKPTSSSESWWIDLDRERFYLRAGSEAPRMSAGCRASFIDGMPRAFHDGHSRKPTAVSNFEREQQLITFAGQR